MRMWHRIRAGLLAALVICTVLCGSWAGGRAAMAAVKPLESPAESLAGGIGGKFAGSGIRRHSFLMVGEENPTIFMIKGGKVIWTYRLPKSKRFTELDDVTQLTNGNIVFDTGTGAREITYPGKKVVWNYEGPPHTQIHCAQPIGLNKVLIMQNGNPAKLLIINIHTRKIIKEMILPTREPATKWMQVHGQFRHVEMTAAGTFLVPHMDLNKVCEYTPAGKVIWTCPFKSPWAAVRLKNGDTLISGNGYGDVVEVNPAAKVVWKFSNRNMPPGFRLYTVQECDRLANGNTLICNWSGNRKQWRTMAQIVEVTPQKKVVWILHDFRDIPAPGSSIQLLGQPGNPEIPGQQQR